jgi:RNA polymerase sigma-70 factor, ECF subfamily
VKSKQDNVVLAQNGDNDAFQQLMKSEQEKLYRIAYTYVHNEEDALEIVQETFYKAFLSIKKLKEPKFFSTWLTKILINSALSFIKKQKKYVLFSESHEQKYSTTHPHQEEKIDLLRAIMALPNKYKTIINLRFYLDYSLAQIAEVLDIPEGTVKTQIHRATKKLEKMLGGDIGYERFYKESCE